MPDPNDRLRLDGARWRAEVDRRHDADPDAMLEWVTQAPAEPPRRWFTGRAPLLLSAAAVTVAALAVGTGMLVSSGAHGPDSTGRGAAVSTGAPTAASTGSATGTETDGRAPLGRHATRATTPAPRPDPVTAHPSRARHTGGRRHETAPTPSSAAPAACDPASLTVSVSAPAASDGQDAITVAAVNGAATACSLAGYPAVQLTGDSTVSATTAPDQADPVVLAPGGTAQAEIDWTAPKFDGCPVFATVLVSLPGGGQQSFALDPTATVCAGSTLVAHPFTGG